MLYSLLGVSIFAGLGTMILLMVLNVKVLKWVRAAQSDNLKAKDERIKAVTEVRVHLPCTFPVPSLYLPCTFPVPSLYLPCTFPVLSAVTEVRVHLEMTSPR
jgi:hypothetical protein